MNRSAKRHRSTKVPNVKLRPAPTEASGSRKDRRQQEAEAEREDLVHFRRLREAYKTGKARASEDDDDDDDDDGAAQGGDDDEDTPPLLGCVICMTGIVEDKSKLVEYATTLGAQIQGNLTEDATHLIAQAPGSDKYHCAVRLGLPILRPEWIRELRARWTTAVDYDFDGLMEEYRLDTFESLVAALAGITEPAERTEIRTKLKSGSAKTPTTFTLDGSFTHLICGDIKDSKTMQVVARYRQKADRFRRRGEDLPVEGESQAGEMKAAIELRAVWKEWVEDCLEVQGSIDEKLYSVDSPRMTAAQRSKIKDAILHEKAARGRANKERMEAARHLSRARSTGKHVGAARESKSGTTGSHDVRRIVKKPRIEMDQYVQHITSAGKDTMVSSTASDENHSEKSTTKGLQRVRSFIEPSEQPAVLERFTPSSDLLPSRIARDARPEKPKGSVPIDEDEEGEEDDDMTLEEEPAAGLYADIREKSLASLSFRVDLRDEDRNRAARKALAGQKIKNIVSAGDAEDAHFHILPLGKVAVESAGSAVLGVPVTHLFVERCLFESRIVALSESFALQPAAVELPLQGAERVFVALSGFAAEDDMDRKQVEIALRAAGLDVSSTLKRGHHTHLLLGKEASTSKSSQMKMQRAKEWGIHIVDFDFVDRIYRSGEINPAVSPAGPSHTLQNMMRQRRGESVGASIGETQRIEPRAEPGPLTVNKQVSNALESSRQWQRSASSSQTFLDGERDRGSSFGNHLPGSSLRHSHVESLEAGSQAIKTSAEQVMALLGSRKPIGNNGGDGSPMERSGSATSTNAARKRGRFLHSRLREKRADSEKVAGGDAASAEELLALRREEEYLQQQGGGGGGLLGPTQVVSSSLPHHLLPSSQRVVQDESLRITYDDPVSRRERRKIGDLIATSVKNLQAQKERDEELREKGGSTRSSSTEGDEEGEEEQQRAAVGRMSRTKSTSTSPTKMIGSPAAAATAFQPSIQARKQPGTSNRQ